MRLDFLNKNYRKEKKRVGNMFPKHLVNKKIINLFKDENLRDLIYNQYIDKSEHDFNNFVEIYELNPNLALSFLKHNCIIDDKTKETIIKYNKYNFEYEFYSDSVIQNKLEKVISEYGDSIIPYLKKDFDSTISLLSESEINKDNYQIFLNNPDISKYILSIYDDTFKEILLKQLFKNDISKLQQIITLYETQLKSMGNRGRLFLDFLDYVNFDESITDDILKMKSANPSISPDDILKIYTNDKEHEKLYDKFIEYKISKTDDLPNIKNLLITKFSGLQIDAINKLLEVRNLIKNNDALIDNIDNIISLSKAKTMEEVEQIIQNTNFMNRINFQKELYNIYKLDLQECVFKPDKSKKVITDDDIDLTSFKMFVHVIQDDRMTNSELAKGLGNNPSLWETGIGSSNLSCSMISEYHMNLFSLPNQATVILGFSEFDDTFIKSVSLGDDRSDTGNHGKDDFSDKIRNIDGLLLPSTLCDHFSETPHVAASYNEIVIPRYEKGQAKRPDYIIQIINNDDYHFNHNKETDKIWAEYFHIPIVQIDGEKIYDKAKLKLDKQLEDLQNRKSGISLLEFEEILKTIRTIQTVKNIRFNMFDLFQTIININKKYHDTEHLREIVEKYIGYVDKMFKEDLEINNSNDKLEFDRRMREFSKIQEEIKNQNIAINSTNVESIDLESKSSIL